MFRFSPTAFRHVVRASAVYDVLATAPFATPWSFAWNWRQLSDINVRLGGIALPAFDVYATLVACLMGSIVLVWTALSGPFVGWGKLERHGTVKARA